MQKGAIFGESIYSSFRNFNSIFQYFIPTVLLAIVACAFATISSSQDHEKKANMQKINEHRQRLNKIDWNLFKGSDGYILHTVLR